MKVHFSAALAAALAVAACSTAGGVAPTAAVESGDDAYFIIGVDPPNAKLLIAEGDVANGVVTRHNGGPLSDQVPFLGRPDGGYIVARANRAGDTLAIWKLQFMDADGEMSGGQTYAPCNRGKSPVFNVPGGTVVYVGDVHFAIDRDHVFGQFNTAGVQTTHDLQAARAYLAEHYPALADRLVDGGNELLWGYGCY